MSTLSPLARRVLRAVYALTESGLAPSCASILAVVPAKHADVLAAIEALETDGFLDASRMRLTMAGLAAACAPRMEAVDRRRSARDRHWAGAMSLAPQRETIALLGPGLRAPGLRKATSVA